MKTKNLLQKFTKKKNLVQLIKEDTKKGYQQKRDTNKVQFIKRNKR